MRKNSIIISVLLLFCSLKVLGQGTVTVAPDSARYNGEYILEGQIDQATRVFGFFIVNDPSLNAGETITVTFPNGTIVPSTIDPSSVITTGLSKYAETNTSAATTVSVSGQSVTITIAVNMTENSTFTIRFLETSGIINPTAGTYSMSYVTPKQPSNTTSNYTIVNSESEMSPASVSVFSSTEGFPADYTISFSTGPGGYLTPSDTLFVTFPIGTSIPNASVVGSTIQVNGVASSAIATSADRRIAVTIPSIIQNNSPVTIFIASGLNIVNPTAGNYTISTRTSAEPSSVTSESYTISAANEISVQRVTLSNNYVNANSSYTLEFQLGSNGALTTSDDITLVFPGTTSIPNFINTSQVTIDGGGFTDNASSVTVVGNTVTLGVPYPISGGSQVAITFGGGAGILNPAFSGSYQISLETSNVNDPLVISNPYVINQAITQVTTATVIPTPSSTSSSSTYQINFSTGDNGRLIGGQSTVSLTFPNGTGYAGASATINGVAVPGGNINRVGDEFTITLPASVSIPNNGVVNFVVSNLTNPGIASAYTIRVSSSSEPNDRISNQYLIGATSLTIDGFAFNGNLVNNPERLRLNVTTNFALYYDNGTLFSSAIYDYFRIIYPEGTQLPATIATTDVDLRWGGTTRNPARVEVNQNYRFVDVYLPNNQQINPGTAVRIRILDGADVRHPSVPGSDYTLRVYSTGDLNPVESNTYTLSSNSVAVTPGSVSAFPEAINETNVQYQVSFTSGTFGRLIGGTSFGSNTITVRFPNEVQLASTPDPSDIKVNGIAASSISATLGSGPNITIDVPSGSIIPSNTETVVLFSSPVGLAHNNTSGPTSLQVSTSAENVNTTLNYTIANALPLTVSQLSLSPNFVNANAAYTLKFTPGTGNDLVAGDTLLMTFPANTIVPASPSDPTQTAFTRFNVLLNGQNPSSVGISSGNPRTLWMVLPSGLSMASSTIHTINISSNAGIINPSSVGSNYRVSFRTSREGPALSPSYSIVAAPISSISGLNVAMSNPVQNQSSNYTISFTTGQYGRLIGGSSSIDLNFSYAISPSSITLNGTNVPLATVTGIGTSSLSLLVPNSVEILSSDNVSIVLTGVTNPSNGIYSFTGNTSVEMTVINSANYEVVITNNPINISNVILPTGRDTVNQFTDIEVTARLQENATSLTLVFPPSTELPLTIDPSSVTVNGAGGVTSVIPNQFDKSIRINYPFNPGGVLTDYQIRISAASQIRNQQYPDQYRIAGFTNAQTLTDSSDVTFTIIPSTSTILTINFITANENVINGLQSWVWNLTTGSYGAIEPGRGLIKLVYPPNQSIIPFSIPTSAILINGRNPQRITVSEDTLILTVPTSVVIGNNSTFTVTVTENANIQLLDAPVSGTRNKGNKDSFDGSSTKASQTYNAQTSSEIAPSSILTNPLPVELTYFGVSTQGSGFDERAFIQWKTATESENFGFEIQRRLIHSYTENTDTLWQKISFVEGAGFSTEELIYEYEDRSLQQAGVYEYRLKQIDFSGVTTSFDPVEFKFAIPEKFELWNNYPNPFNPSTTIPYAVASKTKVTIQVYDVLGRLVRTLVNADQTPGRYSYTFEASQLASGMYFVRMQADGNVFTKKMLLIK